MTLEEVRAAVAKDPYAMFLGIEVAEAAPDRAVVTVPLKEEYNNSYNQAHGGLIFSLVDMAFASLGAANDKFAVNAQSSISYLRAGKNGPLHAVATPLRKGRKLFVCDVQVLDSEDTPIASAIVNGFVIQPAK